MDFRIQVLCFLPYREQNTSLTLHSTYNTTRAPSVISVANSQEPSNPFDGKV